VKPIVAYSNIGEMACPFNTLNITLVAIIQVVIARNKVNMFKICIHVLQCPEAVVQCDNVKTGTVVVPIAQKQAGFATFRLGLGRSPLHKVQAVLVVSDAIALEAKMDVSEDRGFAE
jgi:hypothetical protein